LFFALWSGSLSPLFEAVSEGIVGFGLGGMRPLRRERESSSAREVGGDDVSWVWS